jgi:hypothetical protein
MVPQDLRTLAEIFEKVAREQAMQQQASKLWH